MYSLHNPPPPAGLFFYALLRGGEGLLERGGVRQGAYLRGGGGKNRENDYLPLTIMGGGGEGCGQGHFNMLTVCFKLRARRHLNLIYSTFTSNFLS